VRQTVASALGPVCVPERHQRELAVRLADDDPALLLGPLAAARPHLTSADPATAAQLGDVVTRIDRIEEASRRP